MINATIYMGISMGISFIIISYQSDYLWEFPAFPEVMIKLTQIHSPHHKWLNIHIDTIVIPH